LRSVLAGAVVAAVVVAVVVAPVVGEELEEFDEHTNALGTEGCGLSHEQAVRAQETFGVGWHFALGKDDGLALA